MRSRFILHLQGVDYAFVKPHARFECIGLTDVAKGQSGTDDDIAFEKADRRALRAKIEEYQPRVLAFNGKRAAQEFFGRRRVEYGIQAERIDATQLFVAPSTSGAANAFWDIEIWHALARRCAE